MPDLALSRLFDSNTKWCLDLIRFLDWISFCFVSVKTPMWNCCFCVYELMISIFLMFFVLESVVKNCCFLKFFLSSFDITEWEPLTL